jgi:L-ornithine Nalpha-acyltransferase
VLTIAKGRYRACEARTLAEVEEAQRLRYLAFHGVALTPAGLGDSDAFDPLCRHFLVRSNDDDRLVACFRLRRFASGASLADSYAAQFYGLSGLSAFAGPLLELGRFCLHPDWHDPDILRIAWGALARVVDTEGIEILFGCSSFAGVTPEPYAEAFRMLRQGHLAPPHWRPEVRSADVFAFGQQDSTMPVDQRRALGVMPPLLRTYLMMGGWVSDHAVIDRAMNTIHVFTGLEIRLIPPARARALRAVAAELTTR